MYPIPQLLFSKQGIQEAKFLFPDWGIKSALAKVKVKVNSGMGCPAHDTCAGVEIRRGYSQLRH
jgi:hypothetical protein